VVITGIWNILGGSNVGGVIRTLRLLRPLRSINKVRGIRDIILSLIQSL
jgi:hypothetical protein